MKKIKILLMFFIGTLTNRLATIILMLCFSLVITNSNAQPSNVGKRYPSEKQVLIDRITGFPITALTILSGQGFQLIPNPPPMDIRRQVHNLSLKSHR